MCSNKLDKEIRQLIDVIESDVSECKYELSQAKIRFDEYIKNYINNKKGYTDYQTEVVKLRPIFDWIIFDSGSCFKETLSVLFRLKSEYKL